METPDFRGDAIKILGFIDRDAMSFLIVADFFYGVVAFHLISSDEIIQ